MAHAHRTGAARRLGWGCLLFLPLALHCGGGGGEPEEPAEQTPGQAFCGAVEETLSKCAGSTPCDQALVADCANLVDILNPDLISTATACVNEGAGFPLGCVVQGLEGLAPSQAQRDLAAAFCASCAFGLPGCEDVFFSADGSDYALGVVVLPFSDEVVAQLQADCTAGPTCGATFLGCAQQTLAKHALPVDTATCMVTSILDGSAALSAPSGDCLGSGEGAGGAASTGSGEGASSSTGGEGASSSTGGEGATGSGTGASGSTTSGGGLDCHDWDDDMGGCLQRDCKFCVTDDTCWPGDMPTEDIPCPPLCDSHNGDVTGCDADPQDCAYYFCSESCWPQGTPLEIACPS